MRAREIIALVQIQIPLREVEERNGEDPEICLDIFPAVGTTRRSFFGITELKKLAIVPVMVGLRLGILAGIGVEWVNREPRYVFVKASEGNGVFMQDGAANVRRPRSYLTHLACLM